MINIVTLAFTVYCIVRLEEGLFLVLESGYRNPRVPKVLLPLTVLKIKSVEQTKQKEENQLSFKIQVGHGFGFGSFHFTPGKAQGSLILTLTAAEEGFVYIYNSVCKRTGLLPY